MPETDQLTLTGHLPAAYDDELLSIMGELGLADVDESGTTPRFLGFRHAPAAWYVMKQRGRLPTQIEQSIQGSLAADDQATLAGGVYSYATALQTSEMFAEQIASGLTPRAKLRAEHIRRQAALSIPVAADQPAFAAWVQRVSGEAMNLRSVEMTHEQSRKLVWANYETDQVMIASAFDGLKDELPRIWGRQLQVSESLIVQAVTGARKIPQPPDHLLHEYANLAAGELEYGLSQGMTQEAAIRSAKARAAERFTLKHPPMIWTDGVYLTDAADFPPPPDFADRIREDLLVAYRKDEKATNEAMNWYRPVWDASIAWTDPETKLRLQGAWVMRDEFDGHLLTIEQDGHGVFVSAPKYARKSILISPQEAERRFREAMGLGGGPAPEPAPWPQPPWGERKPFLPTFREAK